MVACANAADRPSKNAALSVSARWLPSGCVADPGVEHVAVSRRGTRDTDRVESLLVLPPAAADETLVVEQDTLAPEAQAPAARVVVGVQLVQLGALRVGHHRIIAAVGRRAGNGHYADLWTSASLAQPMHSVA